MTSCCSAFRRAPAPSRSPARWATLRLFAAANAAQWNAAIRHRLDSGLPAEAVSACAAMLRAGARPDAFTLPLLNRAAALLPGRGLAVGAAHSVGLRAGLGGDAYFCNTLLQAYVRRGAMARARQLFDGMRSRDVVSWTSLVSAYTGARDAQAVSRLVSTMRADGCEPSAATLAVLLRACMAERAAAAGGQLHCYAVKSGWSGDVVVLNSILTHLRRITGVDIAVRLFEQSPRSDAVSWNIIISEYSSEGRVSKVVDMYERMRREEVCPSCETLTSVVAAFAKCRHLRQGQKLHSFALKSGLIDTILVASFVDFYAKCGELPSSVQLFEEFRGKNNCIWSAMLAAFIHHGQFLDAIHLFGRIMDSSLVPSADVLRALVICYTELGYLRLGKVVHGYMIRNDYAAESQSCALETSIVKLYARCGNIHSAERCFSSIPHKDIVSWSSMIETYAIHGDGRKALALFGQMLEEGARPNGVTFLSLLSACGHSGLVTEAREFFDCMTRKFGIAPELGHYTCMVDVLGRSGNLEEAVQVISDMTVKPDGRIWGALLASCKTHSNSKLANLAPQKLMELELNNVGYHVVFGNVQAGGSRWGEVEDIRSSMVDKDMQKSPAWSCVSDIWWCLICTKSISNYKTFDFFYPKFNHSSYSKNCA